MIAIAVAVLLLSSGSATQAGFGSPEFIPNFNQLACNPLPPAFVDPTLAGTGPTCVQTKTASTATDIGIVFDVPAGHHNYSGSLFVSTSEATFKNDADIADGTKVGGLRSDTSLGLTNNVCGAAGQLHPEFVFFEATTNTGNVVVTQPPGTPGRFSTLATDGGDSLPGIADSNSPAVTQYPDFLNTFFNGAVPKARYAGLTQVPAGGDWQILQINVFDPAVLRAAFNTIGGANRTHPFARLTLALGTVLISVLNDPTETTPSISSISDFCSPLALTLGLKGIATTPSTAGNHFTGVITQSSRDNDSDGFEDGFDTCPGATNIENQYGPAYDDGPDNDNYDSACDPTPGANTNTNDHDADGYANAQDNCPSNPGGTPDNSEPGGTYVAASADGGPNGDGMGDDCDTDDVVANGAFFQAHFVDSNCIGADADDDGWCDGTPGETGGYEGTYSKRISAASNSPAPNNATADDDGDGITNGNEIIIGTDPANDCPLIKGHDAWPADFDQSRVINTTDVFKVLPPTLGTSTGNVNFSVRADLAPSGVINTTDVFKVLPPTLGTSCTP